MITNHKSTWRWINKTITTTITRYWQISHWHKMDDNVGWVNGREERVKIKNYNVRSKCTYDVIMTSLSLFKERHLLFVSFWLHVSVVRYRTIELLGTNFTVVVFTWTFPLTWLVPTISRDIGLENRQKIMNDVILCNKLRWYQEVAELCLNDPIIHKCERWTSTHFERFRFIAGG